jgi:predicted nucleic acid-binding Zn ribbon protein
VKKIKDKKCKECGNTYTPFNSLQQVCSPKCASLLAEKKVWKKKKADFIKNIKTKQDYIKTLQTVFNKFIRLRDKDKGCISCGKPLKEGNTDAGHLWPTKYSNIRFNEFNVNGQCSRPCNKDKSGDINNYRINFVKRYSEEKLKELDEIAHIEKKYTIEEIQELIKIYKLKIKEHGKSTNN